MQSLQNSIDRRNVQQKRFKSYERNLKEYASEIKEKLDTGRERFSQVDARNQDARARSAKKVLDDHKRIDSQVSDRKQRIHERSIYLSELNESRMEDNLENQQMCKYQLNCIKERVRRKYIKTQKRRALQMEQVAPPTTYEIYMQNQSVRPSTQGTWSNPFSQAPTATTAAKTPGAAMSKTTHTFDISPQAMANPHLDFSLRLAMQTTFDGTNPAQKKKRKGGI